MQLLVAHVTDMTRALCIHHYSCVHIANGWHVPDTQNATYSMMLNQHTSRAQPLAAVPACTHLQHAAVDCIQCWAAEGGGQVIVVFHM
jgi:hypothetical protein